jgi:hypothetical protein
MGRLDTQKRRPLAADRGGWGRRSGYRHGTNSRSVSGKLRSGFTATELAQIKRAADSGAEMPPL